MNISDLSYDFIIPVFHPGSTFDRLLRLLRNQDPAPHAIILMETLLPGETATAYEGCQIYRVDAAAFDHAATRRLAVEKSTADAFIMLTQDAMPVDDQLARNLLNDLYPGLTAEKHKGEGKYGADSGRLRRLTAMCYGRQLPAKECSPEERYARTFNYPEQGMTKSKADLERLGIRTYFASNVCCAYDRKIYEDLGGFVHEAIFNEDMLYAARAIQAGYQVVYEPRARVIHSHNYTALQQLHRNFDNGMSQAMHPEVFSGIRSEGEGIRLVRSTATQLIKTGKPFRVFSLVRSSGYKYLGFRLGRSWQKLPPSMVRKLAMNKFYIDRIYEKK